MSTRRNFLKAIGFAAAGTAVSTVAAADLVAPVPQARDEFVAISRETYDAIVAWKDAHVATVEGHAGNWGEVVGPARQRMIFALLRETRRAV